MGEVMCYMALKLTKVIHDVATNEVKTINLTSDEIKEREAEIAIWNARMAEIEANNEINLAKKNAILTKLGITEDEAKLLLA